MNFWVYFQYLYCIKKYIQISFFLTIKTIIFLLLLIIIILIYYFLIQVNHCSTRYKKQITVNKKKQTNEKKKIN